MLLSEMQVIDNVKIPMENNESKNFDHIKTLMESYQKELNFAEP